MPIWSSRNMMEALRRDIDRAFSNAGFSSEPFFRNAFLPGRAARHYPRINLHEDADTLYIEALAPGVDPTSLDVSVVRNVLTVSGEKRRHPEEIKPEAFHRREREAGKFTRSIELPSDVDEDRVKADYRNGLLVITLPKAEHTKPKQIDVRVSS